MANKFIEKKIETKNFNESFFIFYVKLHMP